MMGGVMKFDDLSADKQKFIADQMKSLVEIAVNAMGTVGFEIVKHLTIINGAGIAGATAMSTKPGAENSLPWFCAGMLLSILTMIFIYANGFHYMKHIANKQVEILFGRADVGDFRASPGFWLRIKITWCIGAFSILSFVVGVLHLTGIFGLM